MSPNKGKSFWTPEAEAGKTEEFFQWVGTDVVLNLTVRNLRKVFGEIATDSNNLNTDGSANWELMLKDWSDFTAGVAKLSDLEEQISELQDQISVIVFDEKMAVGDNGQPEFPEDYIRLSEQAKVLNQKIRPLKSQHKAISEKYAARAAARAAKAEASSPSKTA